ncbi:hypothetical protein ACFE04_010794 [Oxalis oulophora]
MSEKVSGGKETKDGANANLQVVPTHQPLEVNLPKDRQVDSLSNSPISFSSTLKSKYGRDNSQETSRTVEEPRVIKKAECRQNEAKESQSEWVEQYETGVYITFTNLPSGQKGLKHVRFRNNFDANNNNNNYSLPNNMCENESLLLPTTLSDPHDRTVQQAILAIKKGSQLLKCGRRGKPKFCPFRLSTDERFLIWYDGQEEKQMRLSSVTTIVRGQRTVNFQRQLQPDREQQSFSLIYANGERSMDLICKDREQAETWFVGLRAVISKSQVPKPFSSLRSRRGAQSCINSPAGFVKRRQNLGLLEDNNDYSQVYSVCGSPSQSLSVRCFSDGLSYASESFYSTETSLPHMQSVTNVSTPTSPYVEPDNIEKWQLDFAGLESKKNVSDRFVAPTHLSPIIEKNEILKDVLIWGEGVMGGSIGGMVDKSAFHKDHNGVQMDSLLPKLLESTTMLDVRKISLGAKHAALVTKQGEVFSWGDGNGGRLGHKVNMDVTQPKLVESLNSFSVQSVACGEYQTCAITQSGELYTWGDINHSTDMVSEVKKASHWLPWKVSGLLDGLTVLYVACGEWHTAIVSTNERLFTYGDGTFGVLGHGNLESVYQPKEVDSFNGLKVKSVSCGPWHTAAIVEIMVERYKFNSPGGKLFTWGDGDKGKLGHADTERKLLPTCVAELVDCDFFQVSCGRTLTVALTTTGKVYTMGSAVHGQLGSPHAKDKSINLVEGMLKQEFVKEIASGSYHVAVLTSSGAVYTWGKGVNGQLGLGDSQDRNLPTFVEALADRRIESIACGSNLTAVICLHKSISSLDQSACSGCRMPFGFTKKKHNCYNCGLQFCRACSSKKAPNAALAPFRSKLCRVCDPCFIRLQKNTPSGRPNLNLENKSPRQMGFSDIKEDSRGEMTPSRGQFLSFTSESQYGERKSWKNESEKQLEPLSTLTITPPRWGQVSCPSQFDKSCCDNSLSITIYKNRSSSASSPYFQRTSLGSESSIEKFTSVDEGLYESNTKLTEEIQMLRVEARSLETQCEVGKQKIQECQQQIDNAWSVARDEAAKCKAAKDLIQALVFRLHTMSEKVSGGKETKDGANANLQVVPTHQPLEVNLPKDRQVDSLSNSPISFSSTLKSKYGRDNSQETSRTVEEPQVVKKAECRQNEAKESQNEWVEQYETGVYITFTNLPSGQKGLKRVRFSRKRFAEKEAEKWWEQNQAIVYEFYGIEGYTNSNQKHLKG